MAACDESPGGRPGTANAVAGTASAGSDFGAVTGLITFAAGQATAQITVPVIGDTATNGGEPVETFNVELFDALGAIIPGGAASAVVTIAEVRLPKPT